MRYFIELSYHGKNYHGWQKQPHESSVQQTVENALSTLLKKRISVVGCGRTDTGVHASQYFCHFDYEGAFDKMKLKFRLNGFLPEDIAIFRILRVENSAHARFDAYSREYLYKISLEKNVFGNQLSLVAPQLNLDVESMNRACRLMMQYTDFKCFSRSRTDVKTYKCTISRAEWFQKGTDLTFHIRANRFLRNMVRAIVGTMIEIGQEKMTLEQFKMVIEERDRNRAGASVKARGLYLVEVEYPNKIFIE